MDNQKLLEVATKIKKPLSLIALISIILLIILLAILSLGDFSTLGEQNSFQLLITIVYGLFILACLASILGMIAYIYTYRIQGTDKIQERNKNNSIDSSIAENDFLIYPQY